MVDEHGSIDRQAEELARFAGITAALPSDELSRINREELAELSRLSGAAFDRAYMTQQVEAHQRTLILVRAGRRASRNDQLSTMLSAVVEPAVRTHLADAEALRASLP
jgi:putative membrane protein